MFLLLHMSVNVFPRAVHGHNTNFALSEDPSVISQVPCIAHTLTVLHCKLCSARGFAKLKQTKCRHAHKTVKRSSSDLLGAGEQRTEVFGKNALFKHKE